MNHPAFNLAGRRALVTGSSQGIGLGLAQRFAADGMRVVMSDIEAPALEREAAALADFLIPMLDIYPQRRASAEEMLKHPWLDRDTTQLFATEEEIFAHPELYDRRFADQSVFSRVVNEQEFDADESGDEEEDADVEYYEDEYGKQTKVFDRSFKQHYVGYADGIDLNKLDDTTNWKFDDNINDK